MKNFCDCMIVYLIKIPTQNIIYRWDESVVSGL